MNHNSCSQIPTWIITLFIFVLGTIGSAAAYLFIWNSQLQSDVDVLEERVGRNTGIIERLMEK